MTLLLDAFAVIASVGGEPAGALVEEELRRPEADVCIASVNYGEVLDQLIRVGQLHPAAVDGAMRLLMAAGMRVVPIDAELGRAAGLLRAKHYRRRVAEVSLADCCALAVAATIGARLATADPALIAVAAAENVRVLQLPGSAQNST